MPNEQLVSYIRGEFARGVDRETVTRSLLSTGWKVEDVNAAMGVVAPAADVPAAPRVPIAPPLQSMHAGSSSQANSLKTTIQNVASGLFISCVAILTVVAILGVWKVFSGDVISKSFETLGLLAVVAVIVIVASRFVGDPSVATEPEPRPGYRAIRNSTLASLIVSSALLAFLGVLSIWDVITDRLLMEKLLTTLGIIAFSSFIIVLVCLEREQNQFWKKHAKGLSGGSIIGMIIFVWLLFSLARFIF